MFPYASFAPSTPPALRPDVYRDAAGEWRWRLVARNGRIIADSGEGYRDLSDCVHGLVLVATFDGTNGPRIRFVIRPDIGGFWRWSLVTANGNIIADSGEGYRDRADCLIGLRLLAAWRG